MWETILIFIFTVATFGLAGALYFLPTLIAWKRKNIHTKKIFIVNLFVAWTGLFWLISMAWALGFNITKKDLIKDKVQTLHRLLPEKNEQQTVDFIVAQTGWMKEDAIRVVNHMVKEGMLTEEMNNEDGSWYYYVTSDVEAGQAHLPISARAESLKVDDV